MRNIDTLIEQYVMGNMSAEEAASFENYIAENPEAKAEVSMQQNILEAIKQTRRLELKTKLMQVNPTIISPLAQKIVISLATFATASLVGFGIYTSSLNQSNNSNTETIKTTQIVEKQNYISRKTDVLVEEKETNKIESITNTSSPTLPTKINSNQKVEAKKSSTETATTSKRQAFDPLQSSLSTKDEKELATEETLPKDHQNGSIEKEAINISIDESYEYLGYVYDGKNLQLLGEFKKGKDAYIVEKKAGFFLLKYQGDIYQIEETSKIEKLEDHVITDEKLIEALK